jgi:hypothetical protein
MCSKGIWRARTDKLQPLETPGRAPGARPSLDPTVHLNAKLVGRFTEGTVEYDIIPLEISLTPAAGLLKAS